MVKKKKNFFKNLKRYFKNTKLTKHHFYYSALIMIILILSVFLLNNYDKCKIYEVSAKSDTFNVDNGLIVVTDDDCLIRISNISYKGGITNVVSVHIGLYVEANNTEYLLNEFGSNSSEGFNLNDYLSKLNFNISEDSNSRDVFTSKVKRNIDENLYIKIKMTSVEGLDVDENIDLEPSIKYQNSKLFY